ncbi:MAG: 3-hydroxyacyl-ACP dehydratase FabZ [bacterium]
MTDEILQTIPHRPPFLLVDRIVELAEDKITTEKLISPDESFFAGHYPGNPVMPGVLVCEAVFQSGALLVAKKIESEAPGKKPGGFPVLTRIREAKFKKMVLPGDLLEMEAEITEKLGSAYFMKGTARVKGLVSVRVKFAATLVENR